MSNCPLYRVHRQPGPVSREIRADQQHVQLPDAFIPHCLHDGSPAPLRIVRQVIGGAQVLQCGGDLERCQVPKDKRNVDLAS